MWKSVMHNDCRTQQMKAYRYARACLYLDAHIGHPQNTLQTRKSQHTSKVLDTVKEQHMLDCTVRYI